MFAVEPGDRRPLQLYAEEVAPAVRELVEAERLTPGARPEPAAVRLEPEEVRAGPGDGDHLVAIHDHLRQELAQVQDLVEQVARGHVDANAARNVINPMTMRQNDWTLGTYCETSCRMVTMHHTIEDHSMHPRLRDAAPRSPPRSTGCSSSTTRSTASSRVSTMRWSARSATPHRSGRRPHGAGPIGRVAPGASRVRESQTVEPPNRLSVGF